MELSSPTNQRQIHSTILAVGSRGDVQPLCALAVGLQRAGHRVRVATHGNFKEFVSQLGLEFAPLAGNFEELLKSVEGEKLLAGKRNKLISDELFQELLINSWACCQGTDVVIFGQLATWGYHIAEKLDVPGLIAATCPLSPTREFPFLQSSKAVKKPWSGLLNYGSYLLIDFLFWQKNRKAINRFRKEILELPPLPFLGNQFRRKQPKNLSPLPFLYGFSPLVIPKPLDWSDWLNVTGYWFLDSSVHYQPPKELLDFINNGSAPVCIGFGSMAFGNTSNVAQVLLEALERSQQRGILLSGWAGISNAKKSDNVFIIDSVPHDWLFPRMAAVVHHGGAGTTAAGIRAGVPSVVVPFFADQPFWAERLVELGVSPPPIPFKELSAQRLAAAIQVAVSDKNMQQQAFALGESVRKENGVANAVEAFQSHFKTYPVK